ncbi:unnamed protein product [Blepharisma stoltei]|uniref:EF-hand domain-containing protein n=1 Tax=Blepharisma stoltei TaxID=1481888 RepID=A0AAU9JVZ9_9CILI|nr:unnamed protein product [Blepharisma stoltei]
MNPYPEHSHRSTGSESNLNNLARPGKSTSNLSSEPRSPAKKLSAIPHEQPLIEEKPAQLATPELGFIFSPMRDGVKPYHLDGDTSMYTETAIARRLGLKSDAIVADSINDFMNLYQMDSTGSINKREFERIYNKLCGVLRPGLDPIEKKKLLDEDWKKDAKGQDKMTREALFDALFEMCDIWCPNIDPNEYKEFFDQIKFRIRYEGHRDQGAYDILK